MLKGRSIGLLIAAGISIGGFTHNQPAQAKQYAKVVKISQNLVESSTYFTFTGKNALYTKAATMKGAKLVKTKAQLEQLAHSTNGLDSFMWLRTAITDRGTVYFKISSFDNKIKGWIYAGRTTNYRYGIPYYLDKNHQEPAGGVDNFKTLTDVPMTTEQKTSFYRLANPGTATDGTAMIYSLPFDVSPISTTNFINQPNKKTSGPYKNDIFIIDRVVKRTRQGDLWYSVQDLNRNSIAGYIRASGLTKLATPTTQRGITVNFVDTNTNQKVGSVIVPFSATPKQTGMNLTNNFQYYQGLPTGYSADFESGRYGFGSQAAAKNAHPGAVLTYYVGKESAEN